MKSNTRLYWILAILSVAGYAWIGFQMLGSPAHKAGLTLCIFKNMTGFPCPSCGVTRAMLMMISGNIGQSLMINPLGCIIAPALLIIPVWISIDVIWKKNTLAAGFAWTEQKIRTQKAVYIPLVTLVLLNWCWNLLKDL